ncbi:MAG TPA: hypothetical protein PLP73_00430 [Candidatus Absconditabacterales bacterium]|nr:hypothetical protein [Candidatus Absconditabacterales bacterium]
MTDQNQNPNTANQNLHNESFDIFGGDNDIFENSAVLEPIKDTLEGENFDIEAEQTENKNDEIQEFDPFEDRENKGMEEEKQDVLELDDKDFGVTNEVNEGKNIEGEIINEGDNISSDEINFGTTPEIDALDEIDYLDLDYQGNEVLNDNKPELNVENFDNEMVEKVDNILDLDNEDFEEDKMTGGIENDNMVEDTSDIFENDNLVENNIEDEEKEDVLDLDLDETKLEPIQEIDEIENEFIENKNNENEQDMEDESFDNKENYKEVNQDEDLMEDTEYEEDEELENEEEEELENEEANIEDSIEEESEEDEEEKKEKYSEEEPEEDKEIEEEEEEEINIEDDFEEEPEKVEEKDEEEEKKEERSEEESEEEFEEDEGIEEDEEDEGIEEDEEDEEIKEARERESRVELDKNVSDLQKKLFELIKETKAVHKLVDKDLKEGFDILGGNDDRKKTMYKIFVGDNFASIDKTESFKEEDRDEINTLTFFLENKSLQVLINDELLYDEIDDLINDQSKKLQTLEKLNKFIFLVTEEYKTIEKQKKEKEQKSKIKGIFRNF